MTVGVNMTLDVRMTCACRLEVPRKRPHMFAPVAFCMVAEPPGGSEQIPPAPSERSREGRAAKRKEEEEKRRKEGKEAQEAIRTLKEVKERTERKEGKGFATASKVVKAPEPFSPANMEEELSQWQDWKLSFKSWLCFAGQACSKANGRVVRRKGFAKTYSTNVVEGA